MHLTEHAHLFYNNLMFSLNSLRLCEASFRAAVKTNCPCLVTCFLKLQTAPRLLPSHPPNLHCQLCGGGVSRAIRCTGGHSRASRRHKMPIRRQAPSHPPAISAGIMQLLVTTQVPFSPSFSKMRVSILELGAMKSPSDG